MKFGLLIFCVLLALLSLVSARTLKNRKDYIERNHYDSHRRRVAAQTLEAFEPTASEDTSSDDDEDAHGVLRRFSARKVTDETKVAKTGKPDPPKSGTRRNQKKCENRRRDDKMRKKNYTKKDTHENQQKKNLKSFADQDKEQHQNVILRLLKVLDFLNTRKNIDVYYTKKAPNENIYKATQINPDIKEDAKVENPKHLIDTEDQEKYEASRALNDVDTTTHVGFNEREDETSPKYAFNPYQNIILSNILSLVDPETKDKEQHQHVMRRLLKMFDFLNTRKNIDVYSTKKAPKKNILNATKINPDRKEDAKVENPKHRIDPEDREKYEAHTAINDVHTTKHFGFNDREDEPSPKYASNPYPNIILSNILTLVDPERLGSTNLYPVNDESNELVHSKYLNGVTKLKHYRNRYEIKSDKKLDADGFLAFIRYTTNMLKT